MIIWRQSILSFRGYKAMLFMWILFVKGIYKKYAEINDLKALLASTDYQVIKEAEGGYSVPRQIIDERQDARARINTLQDEIEQLEDALESISAEDEELLNSGNNN